MELAENIVVAGRFRLKRLIGRGGMGTVWEATHLRLDIPCAVKFMDVATVKEAHARFEREAKAAAQLRSPNVVQILDHGMCDDGTPYIAMELLDGEDLGKRLARVGRLAPQELIAIVNQVSRALTKAHQLGIVHRDLKPDNIFIVRDDDREIAKVLDFGIAKSLTHELSGSSTKTGAMLGTPFYMSPEQAQGTKQVDSRSDLWAMAVICFEALTGARPFVSEALGDLLVKIIVSPLPVPSQCGQVPAGFDAWWMRAASRDPAQRFQSAKDFVDSLALACGISQVSGVTDLARHPGSMPPAPPDLYERRNSTPAPAATQGLPGTGSPVARSSPSLAPPPVNKTGLIVGGIAGGILLLATVVGGAIALRAKATPESANGGSAGLPAATAAPSAQPLPAASSAAGSDARPQSSATQVSSAAAAVTLVPVEPPPTQPQATTTASVPKVAPQHSAAATAAPRATGPSTPQPKPTYNPGI
jgi:serine/threonine protein kinase